MTTTLTPDICVIGAGSAGLVVAAGASQLGAETVLIEAGRMGGDCLNTGCVPSKALLAAANAAAAIRRAPAFGVEAGAPEIDFARVHDHVHEVIASIAPHDSVERYEGLGVTVIQARARFTAPDTLRVGDTIIRARRFVIATGGGPLVPPIPGLDSVQFLTNETVFDLTARPDHLLVLGGGPIGCELAQAFRRLGAAVSVVEMATLLPKDDPEAADVVRQRLRAEGIALHEGAKATRVGASGSGLALTIARNGTETVLRGSHLLVAAGRKPGIDGLGLDAAGVAHTKAGITVDAHLKTSNRRIYAIGDVTGGLQFTHMAGHHAGVVIKNALFRLPAKVETRAVPWVTFTDPELAQVGLGETAARAAHGEIRVLRAAFAESDRARAERQRDGFVKIITDRRGRILGATIVGAHAGELIQPWILAIRSRLKIGAMAEMIAPYPTLGEVGKRAAGNFFLPLLLTERTRRIVRFLRRFG
jgi:pyruvate/2-oxoglutarate dehydrogenase complex dihydrolipoamide dehydrogenase (E3) component